LAIAVLVSRRVGENKSASGMTSYQRSSTFAKSSNCLAVGDLAILCESGFERMWSRSLQLLNNEYIGQQISQNSSEALTIEFPLVPMIQNNQKFPQRLYGFQKRRCHELDQSFLMNPTAPRTSSTA
jgi:hypothetical protein